MKLHIVLDAVSDRTSAMDTAAMEALKQSMDDIKKKLEMLRGRQRRALLESDCWPMKKKITMMALLGGTRESIALITALPRHYRIAKAMPSPLSFDRICDIIENTMVQWPNVRLEATSPTSTLRHYAEQQLHECRTNFWLLEQNSKGIAVLPKLVLDFYIDQWGAQPYTEMVSHHVQKFDNNLFCRKWFRRFRLNWGFHYSRMPLESAMTRPEMEQKETEKKNILVFWFVFYKITNQNLLQNRFQFWEHKNDPDLLCSQFIRDPSWSQIYEHRI